MDIQQENAALESPWFYLFYFIRSFLFFLHARPTGGRPSLEGGMGWINCNIIIAPHMPNGELLSRMPQNTTVGWLGAIHDPSQENSPR